MPENNTIEIGIDESEIAEEKDPFQILLVKINELITASCAFNERTRMSKSPGHDCEMFAHEIVQKAALMKTLILDTIGHGGHDDQETAEEKIGNLKVEGAQAFQVEILELLSEILQNPDINLRKSLEGFKRGLAGLEIKNSCLTTEERTRIRVESLP